MLYEVITGTRKIAFLGICAGEIGAREVRIDETSTGDHPSQHVSAGDGSSREIDLFHEHVLEVGAGKICARGLRPVQVGAEQTGLVESGFGKVRVIAIRVKEIRAIV